MICHVCGAELPDGSIGCGYCGTSFTGVSYYPGAVHQEVHQKDRLAEVHLDSGTEIHNRYRILNLLGRGGFCYTYHAYDNVLGVEVAIKEYFPHGVASRSNGNTVTVFTEQDAVTFEKGKRRFLQEARALAKFNGMPGIVSVYDFFEEFSTAYIVMEFLRGRNLRDYMKDLGTSLDFEFVAYVAETLCDTLSEVHKKKIIHRDVSPDNIFLCENGSIKLIDFGALNQLMNPVDTVTVILKTGFAPVEQYYKDGEQGPWTDIYSLGATLYDLLTGIIPPESVGRLMKDTLVCPHLYNTAIPKNFSFAIMRAMEVKKEDRFANMQEFKYALFSDSPTFNKYYEKYEAGSSYEQSANLYSNQRVDSFTDVSEQYSQYGNGKNGTINILESQYYGDGSGNLSSDSVPPYNGGVTPEYSRQPDQGGGTAVSATADSSSKKRMILIGSLLGVAVILLVVGIVMMVRSGKGGSSGSGNSGGGNSGSGSGTAQTPVDSDASMMSVPNVSNWTSDKKIYVYSWDDDLQKKLNIVLNAYPQFKSYVEYVNLGVASEESLELIDQAFSSSKYPSLIASDIGAAKYWTEDDSKTLDLRTIGFTDEMLSDSYQFAKDFATYNGKLKAVTWQTTAGSVFYNRRIAKDVFGTDDPSAIQEKIKDWDSFFKAADQLKAKGYKIVSGPKDVYYAIINAHTNPWVSVSSDGTETFNPDSTINTYIQTAKKLSAGGYTNNTEMWDGYWAESMKDGGNVFCYFACPWMIGVFQSNGATDGSWGACIGPSPYYWGGTYVSVGKDTPNPELCAFLLYELTCDPDIAVRITNETGDAVNNITANQRLINGEIASDNAGVRFLGGQNPYKTWADASKNIKQGAVTYLDKSYEIIISEATYAYIEGTFSSVNETMNYVKQQSRDQLGIKSR